MIVSFLQKIDSFKKVILHLEKIFSCIVPNSPLLEMAVRLFIKKLMHSSELYCKLRKLFDISFPFLWSAESHRRSNFYHISVFVICLLFWDNQTHFNQINPSRMPETLLKMLNNRGPIWLSLHIKWNSWPKGQVILKIFESAEDTTTISGFSLISRVAGERE